MYLHQIGGPVLWASKAYAHTPRRKKIDVTSNDFLPITCSGCSEIFCKDHITLDAHSCSQVNVSTDHGTYTGPKSFACALDGCSNKELTPVVCSACKQNFCLAHRHQVDHSCKNYELPPERMTKTKAHIENIIDKKKSQPVKGKGKGRKSKLTAAKVALMKIKMSASGDRSIPECERVHLQVILPKGSSAPSKPMYFSKVWSIGRVIDAAASLAGLQNNNNVATAKKLRLFDSDDGHLFSTEESLAHHLSDEHGIINGGTIILEYVEDGTVEIVDLDSYKV